MELALALQQSGVKVIALFCTGGVSTSSLARRFKEAQLAYSQTDQGVEYKYKELTVQVLPPNRFLKSYINSIKENPTSIIWHSTNIFDSSILEQQWQKLFSIKATHMAFYILWKDLNNLSL